MTVTDVVEYTKAKYKIFIDGEFAFVLYKGELRLFKMEKGKDISDEVLEKIDEVILKRAKLRAMHLLEKRPYSEYSLRRKLSDNFYSEDIIDLVIEYLKGYKYIDDLSYAITYIETYTGQKTLKRMKQDLMGKGIRTGDIEAAIEHCMDYGELEDEHEMIRKLLKKRGFGEGEVTQKEIYKTVNFLLGKGFGSDAVRYEMRHFLDD